MRMKVAFTRVWEWRWQDLDIEKVCFKQDTVKDVITGMRREDVKNESQSYNAEIAAFDIYILQPERDYKNSHTIATKSLGIEITRNVQCLYEYYFKTLMKTSEEM